MTEVKAKLGEGGRVVIPAAYRKALGLKPGDEVVIVLDEGQIRVFTPHQATKQAQELVRRYISKGRSLSEELLQERREEAARA